MAITTVASLCVCFLAGCKQTKMTTQADKAKLVMDVYSNITFLIGVLTASVLGTTPLDILCTSTGILVIIRDST